MSDSETAPAGLSAKLSLGFSAQFLFIGLYLPYFPLWLQAQNLSPIEISTILALPLVIRVLTTGQVTIFADRQPDRVMVLRGLYFAAAATIALYWWTQSFWAVFAVTLIYNFFFNPLLPLLDAIALSGVRRFGIDYGRVRLWGSLVFILANLGGGFLLAGYSPRVILACLIAAMALGAVASLLLPRIGSVRPPGDPVKEKITRRGLLANRTFLIVLSASGIAQASHAFLYGFGSIHWQALGYSGLAIGAFWAVGVIAEMLLFQYASPILRRFGAVTIIGIGCIGGLVRWGLFPFIDGAFPFFLLQVFHGLSFGAVHIGTMHFILQAVPEENIGAAQGAGYVLGGVAMGVAVFASGPIYAAFGAQGFLAMAAMCGLALLLLAFTPKDRAQADRPAIHDN